MENNSYQGDLRLIEKPLAMKIANGFSNDSIILGIIILLIRMDRLVLLLG
jgi:hypothetical protein